MTRHIMCGASMDYTLTFHRISWKSVDCTFFVSIKSIKSFLKWPIKNETFQDLKQWCFKVLSKTVILRKNFVIIKLILAIIYNFYNNNYSKSFLLNSIPACMWFKLISILHFRLISKVYSNNYNIFITFVHVLLTQHYKRTQ